MGAPTLSEVIDVIRPFIRNKEAIEGATRETKLLDDLRVNSARVIDIVLAIEDRYGCTIEEDEEEGLLSLGDLLDLVSSKQG